MVCFLFFVFELPREPVTSTPRGSLLNRTQRTIELHSVNRNSVKGKEKWRPLGHAQDTSGAQVLGNTWSGQTLREQGGWVEPGGALALHPTRHQL